MYVTFLGAGPIFSIFTLAWPLTVRYERCLALSRAPQAADGGPISVLRRTKGCSVVGHRNIDVGGDRKAAAVRLWSYPCMICRITAWLFLRTL